MKTPIFWLSNNLISTLLTPAAWIYYLVSKLRYQFSAKPVLLDKPVICVGNVVAGGAGKTPTAIAIGKRLKEKGVNAYFLSRGYGGTLTGPVLVNPRVHSAREVGDEPLLLSRELPTVVAKDRLAGARLAIQRGADAIVMDDGFQNPAFVKALSLLVIDSAVGFGNGKLIPAGPLREWPEEGFTRADAAVIIGNASPALPQFLPKIQATLAPDAAANVLKGRNVFAFCGIAYPQKFFDTLTLLGAHIAGSATFSDHHPYSEREIKQLAARAKRKQAILVTTAKDAVRLRAEWQSLVTVIDVSLSFAQPELLDDLLERALRQAW